MKLIITDNEGEPLGEIRENFEFEADLPLQHKDRIRELMQSAKKFNMDVGPVERGGEGFQTTPGEEVTEFDTSEALPRVKAAIDQMTPYHAELEETDPIESIKAVDAPFEAPDGKDVHEGPPGFFYYTVSKGTEEQGDGEVLEVRDYYRVWVQDQESVPDDSMAFYDEDGDEAGNHWYYEVPFETTTRIDLSETDVKPENVVEKDADVEMSLSEVTDFGISESDGKLIEAAHEAVEVNESVWGEYGTVRDSVLKSAESPVTLLSLYKLFYQAGDEYAGYLPPIKAELEARGVRAIDKVTRKRRVFGEAHDDVKLEKSGELLRFERD